MADTTRGEDIHGTVGPASSGASDAAASSRDRPRFQIIRPHDEGGLGKVSVALDTELDREVALKEIKPQYADDASSRSRFLLEAEITGGLEHPGIVPIYGLGSSADGRPYYAMRFIRGDNLATAIKQYHEGEQASEQVDRSVQLRRLLGRFLDVCNAVYYAHQRGVLHRDLKPGNVMLGEYGETLVVDWGLAKPIGAAEESSSEFEDSPTIASPLVPRSGSVVDATQLGSAIGSPHYMSPEQARGEHDKLGPAADVYSLGATLFTLLTNRKPVEGQTLEEILTAVQKGPSKTARQWNPEIDAALSKICAKAMALSAENRYKTVRALADDIERYLADEPVRAYPEPLTRRARRWLRKHPKMVGSLAATLVAGVVSAATIAGVVSSSNAKLGEKNLELAEANTQLEVARDEAVKSRDEAIVAKNQAEAVSSYMIKALRSPDPKMAGRHSTVAEVLDWSARQLEGQFADDPLTKGALLNTLGRTYSGLGLAEEAIPLFEQSLELLQPLFGQNHKNTMRAMSFLAGAHLEAKHFREALEQLEHLLKLRTEHLGKKHPDTIHSLAQFATAKLMNGDHDEALTLIETALTRAREVYGRKDRQTIQIMGNLAMAYLETGRKEDALTLNNQVRALMEEQVDDSHPSMLTMKNNLAQTYSAVGEYEKAIQIQEELLTQTRGLLGLSHPDTLAIAKNLADFLSQTEQYEKARPLYEQTLKRAREELGAEHIDTQQILVSLAMWYVDTLQFDQAIALLEEALQASHDQVAPNHPMRILAAYHLGIAYFEAGRVRESALIFRQTLKHRQESLGEKHRDTLDAQEHLAEALRVLGEVDEALLLHEKTLATRRETLGEADPLTLVAMHNVALALMAKGEQEAAIEVHEQALALLRAQRGEQDVVTLTSMTNLANAYQRVKQLDKALALHQEALRLKRKHLKKDDPYIPISIGHLAGVKVQMGDVEESLALMQEALRMSEANKLLGPNHPNTLEIHQNIALIHSMMGKLQQAAALYEETLTRERKSLSEGHPMTLETMSKLAFLCEKLQKPERAYQLYSELLAFRRTHQGHAHKETLAATYSLAYHCERNAKYAEAAELYGFYGQTLLETGQPGNSSYVVVAQRRAYCVAKEGGYEEAEKSLTAMLGVADQSPDWYLWHDTRSLLGEVKWRLKKIEEAEPLLLAGQQGLVKRQEKVIPDHRFMLAEATERLALFYDSINKPAEAAKWRTELKKFHTKEPEPSKEENPLEELNFNFY